MREGVEDEFRILKTTGEQCKPLQRDHGIAAPIHEPVIARHHGAYLIPLRLPRARIPPGGRAAS